MSYNGHVVIDADSHIREYWDFDRTYKENMDPEYREKYDQFSLAVKSHQPRPGAVGIGEILWPRLPGHPMGVYDAFAVKRPAGDELMSRREGAKGPNGAMTGRGVEIDNSCNWDPAVRLRDMDKAGIDVSVMFASQSDGYCMLDDVGFESALQRAYHRYMSDYCADSNGRLFWIANSNLRDIPESGRGSCAAGSRTSTSRACSSRGRARTGACSTTRRCTRSSPRRRSWTCPSGCMAARTDRRSPPG